MPVITEPTWSLLERTRQNVHSGCMVCGRSHECGLGLRFSLQTDGAVEAGFECEARFQGYDGLLHGGVTSSLMDAAMAHCLFARGIVAVTAEMRVRFLRPIRLHAPLVVRAQIVRSCSCLHLVEAEVLQDGSVKAKAMGKFMQRAGG